MWTGARRTPQSTPSSRARRALQGPGRKAVRAGAARSRGATAPGDARIDREGSFCRAGSRQRARSEACRGLWEAAMAEGMIKRLTDKGFGFIDNGTGKDLFFHMSAVEGCRFEDLREGQKVTYNEGRGPKGPRAENVRVI